MIGNSTAGRSLDVASISRISTFSISPLNSTSASGFRTAISAQEDVITTRGDLIRGSTGAVAERLAVGSANQYLRSDGTDPSWSAIGSTDLPTATTTAQGAVELATDAEFQTGTSTGTVVTPSNVQNSLGFSDFFESAQQTITAGGTLTIAHGLGRQPKFIQVLLVNVTAQYGYTTGDDIHFQTGLYAASSASYGVQFHANSTNLLGQYGVSAGVFEILRRDGTPGTAAVITPGNWRIVVRAWA